MTLRDPSVRVWGEDSIEKGVTDELLLLEVKAYYEQQQSNCESVSEAMFGVCLPILMRREHLSSPLLRYCLTPLCMMGVTDADVVLEWLQTKQGPLVYGPRWTPELVMFARTELIKYRGLIQSLLTAINEELLAEND